MPESEIQSDTETSPPEVESNVHVEEMAFHSENYLLKGTLHLPKNVDHPPVIIGSHGLFSDRRSPKQIELATACNEQGIGFFRFDHRGCGESEGDFREVTTFETRCNDLTSAVKAIQERGDIGRWTGLFGSSLGGAVCLAVSKSLEIDALITLAAALRSGPILKNIQKSEEHQDIDEKVDLNRLRFDMSEKISGIHHILIFHGDSDRVVPPSEAHLIYQKSIMPKRLIMLRKGDHRLTIPENQEKFIRESVAWYKSCYMESKHR